MPKGVKGFQKGNSGRPDGAKNKTTIAKEERRAIFDAEVSQMFLEKIKEARAEYLLDQFLGKSPEKVEHSGEIKGVESTTSQLLAMLKAKLKEKQTGDGL